MTSHSSSQHIRTCGHVACRTRRWPNGHVWIRGGKISFGQKYRSRTGRSVHQVTSVVIQNIPNGRSNWNYCFPFHSYVPVLRGKVNYDLWADLTGKTQDILSLITLTLDGELSAVRAIEFDYESSVFPQFAVFLGGVILESKFRNASFVKEGGSNGL
jgi:hypothetical protein